MSNEAIDFYNYHVWANDRVFDQLIELPSKVLTQEVESVFPTIADVLYHMYVTDVMWLGVLKNEDFEQILDTVNQLKEKERPDDVEGFETLFAGISKEYSVFLDDQKSADQPMKVSHPNLGELDTTLHALVSHVVNHGTYHRGNITAMLRQQGHPGPSTDYVFYLYNN